MVAASTHFVRRTRRKAGKYEWVSYVVTVNTGVGTMVNR